MSRRTLLLLAALTIASAVVYVTRLGYAPAYVMHDETQFALQAESIAASGRDLSGRFLPLFFAEPEFPAGRDPVIIYLTAAALAWLPFSEASVRTPTALLGVLNIALMFLLARRLFGSDSMALVAAGLLAMTPAHFIRSRLLLSPQSSIPFVLAWLLCVAAFSERPTTRRLAMAGGWLGLGAYTYLACMVMMPLYLAMTILLGHRLLGRRGAVVAGAAFVIPLIPMVLWYATHPERWGQVIDAYQLYSGRGAGAAAPIAGAVSSAMRTTVGLIWSFFSPAFLFLSGDSSLINSTRLVGFFPLSFAVFMPLGVLRLAKNGGAMGWVILAGLATAPLAAIVSGAIEMNRILFVIPFGVLTATYGVDWLIGARAHIWRAVALVLVAAVPVQFGGFYWDYMGRYRVEASQWFGGNTRDVFITAIERAGLDSQHRVYVSHAIPFADRYWRFYALERGRRDLIDRMVRYDTASPANALLGSDLVCSLATTECQALLRGDTAWSLVRQITELDGTPSFALFEKRRP